MISLFDRTIGRVRRVLRRGDETDSALAGISPDLDDLEPVRQLVNRSLTQTSAVMARGTAAEIGAVYLSLNDVGRERFLRLLAAEYLSDDTATDAAIDAFRAATDTEAKEVARLELRDALRPAAVRLLMLFNGLEDGTKFVVDLRADLRAMSIESSSLRALDRHVARLLSGWFDVGFLELRSIDWNTSAAVLEKLIEYQAVHEIQGWNDLRNRLSEDRRTFAFFHPQMPGEPLIFVEVAVVDGLADSLPHLLDPHAPITDPATADTTIFYSISNCQAGLAGIPLGDFLIKRVVSQLSHEFPHIHRFATLSPIMGFRSWLLERAGVEVDEGELGPLLPILESPDDYTTPESVEPHQKDLMRLCARYLIHAKRDDGRAVDRVEDFHLSNGARLERLNWMANPSEQGMERAFGMMVNYRYDLDYIGPNHEAYVQSGTVARAAEVADLL